MIWSEVKWTSNLYKIVAVLLPGVAGWLGYSSAEHLLDRSSLHLIVGSLSGSRLKSVRFLVGESSEVMTSSEAVKIIKINH
jgi:hypothetical protein